MTPEEATAVNVVISYLAGAAVLAVVAIAAYLLSRPHAGRSEQQAVKDYVANLNAGDVNGLRGDIYPGGATAASAIVSGAQRPWTVTDITVAHDFGPDYAVAHIGGTRAGQPFTATLPLQRHQGRWYVSVGSTGAVPTGPASQTASTTR